MGSAPGVTPLQETNDLKALTSALDHARTMANQAAEVRMRNFYFFLVITGALVTGCMKPPSWEWVIVFDVAGILSSLLFFGLDVRGRELHTRSIDQIAELEPRLWNFAGMGDKWTPIPRGGIISHKWIYRTFFGIIGVAWATALIVTLTRKAFW